MLTARDSSSGLAGRGGEEPVVAHGRLAQGAVLLVRAVPALPPAVAPQFHGHTGSVGAGELDRAAGGQGEQGSVGGAGGAAPGVVMDSPGGGAQ